MGQKPNEIFSPEFLQKKYSRLNPVIPSHIQKIHIAKKGIKLQTWPQQSPKQSAPCIRGHHQQLNDSLVGQLTT